MSDFLPEGTQVPSAGGNYMKLEAGENKFRALSSAIIGWELWVGGKPLRSKLNDFSSEQVANADINKFTGKRRTPSYFWAFTVYNYKEEKIQILILRQVTIMRGMESFMEDEDFGNPKEYDLVITQHEGENGKAQYQVKAKPPRKLDEGIKKLYEDMEIDLTALYEGKDPFAPVSKEDKVVEDIPF